MNQDVVILEAQINDLDTIQDLNHELFLSDYSSDPFLNVKWPYEKEGKKYFEEAIISDEKCCFVAKINNKIVGYLVGSIRFDSGWRKVIRAELDNMLVRKECRSHGIGEQLASKFFEWAKAKDVKRISVSAYAPNKNAIRFYERLGFMPYEIGLEMDCEEKTGITHAKEKL